MHTSKVITLTKLRGARPPLFIELPFLLLQASVVRGQVLSMWGCGRAGLDVTGLCGWGRHPVTLASSPLSPLFVSSTFDYSVFQGDTKTGLQQSLSIPEIVQNLAKNTHMYFSKVFHSFQQILKDVCERLIQMSPDSSKVFLRAGNPCTTDGVRFKMPVPGTQLRIDYVTGPIKQSAF